MLVVIVLVSELLAGHSVQAQTLNTLYSFCSQANCTDGAGPYAGLVQGTDGNFYGTNTGYGGNTASFCSPSGCGTLFKIAPSGTLTTPYIFCSQANCTDGGYPDAGLLQANDGNFYGVTQGGGTNGWGTVFKINTSGELTTLYSFCAKTTFPDCPDGASPDSLIQGTDGDFYGTTNFGGIDISGYCSSGCGTLFKITPGGTLTTLHSFCSTASCADGSSPDVVIQGTDGDLYGITASGGNKWGAGTFFKITLSGTLTTLHKFCSPHSDGTCIDGSSPNGLIQATDGNFYGTTQFGGRNNSNKNNGTAFKITSSGALTTLHNFCAQANCADGQYPTAGIVQGSDGYLYGTALFLGAYGGGTVFQLPITGGTLQVLHSFCSTSEIIGGNTVCTDGNTPDARLVQGTDGNFYGTTTGGGVNTATYCPDGCGTIFELSTGLGPFILLRSTSGEPGAAVNILGTDLAGASSVTFNGTQATFVVNSNNTAITAIVPTGATTGTVEVVTPGGTLSSDVTYTVEAKTAMPEISPKAGTYTGAEEVTIADATAGAVIYYTLDGTTPTKSSSVYKGPFTINISETLKADAYAPGFTRSGVKTAIYIIQ